MYAVASALPATPTHLSTMSSHHLYSNTLVRTAFSLDLDRCEGAQKAEGWQGL